MINNKCKPCVGSCAKKKCENGEFSVPELIEKAKYLCKSVSLTIDSLMADLMNPSWIQRYTGDPVILKYSYSISKLRSCMDRLKKTYTEAESKLLLKKINSLVDDNLVESLKKLNNSIETELKEFKRI